MNWLLEYYDCNISSFSSPDASFPYKKQAERVRLLYTKMVALIIIQQLQVLLLERDTSVHLFVDEYSCYENHNYKHHC